MDLKLTGRKALVTGGSKGIGLAIALRLALEGCEIVLVARSQSELESAAASISAQAGRHAGITALDMGSAAAAERLCRLHPDIDILVNNAGDIPGGSIEQVSAQALRDSWNVKVFGYMDLIREYLPLMRARGHGVILNIIGVAGEMVDAAYVAGSAGNAALIAMTRAVGSTSLEYGVRVLGINPGPVATDRMMRILHKRAAERLGNAERWPELQARFPAGRAADVDEIAATAALLCSPLSGYTSGTVFNIDGGLSSRQSIA
ncbi:MAG: SDR family oxidoreductase [Burkholderiales bacterium]|nr:SDR family oxidoreductase [Burkholderiales bacterium]